MSFEIEISGLKKNYSYITAIDDLNATFEKGEFITLFGPNGAGKSTLLKILSTLLKPTEGFVTVGGFNLGKERNEIRNIIGFVSHQNMLYENLTAFENLKFISTFYGIEKAEEICRKLLQNMSLYERREDPVKSFSSGMKQRLAIARTLINNPKILFLDEPYNGLDQEGIGNFSNILSELKNSGHTIFLTTHNIDEGLELSDRLMILNKGKFVFDQKNNYRKEEFKEIYSSVLNN